MIGTVAKGLATFAGGMAGLYAGWTALDHTDFKPVLKYGARPRTWLRANSNLRVLSDAF